MQCHYETVMCSAMSYVHLTPLLYANIFKLVALWYNYSIKF